MARRLDGSHFDHLVWNAQREPDRSLVLGPSQLADRSFQLCPAVLAHLSKYRFARTGTVPLLRALSAAEVERHPREKLAGILLRALPASWLCSIWGAYCLINV